MISKYSLRIFLAPKLAKIGRLLGRSWEDLGDQLGREVMLAQADEILKKTSGTINPTNEPLDIIFLTMIGGHSYNTAVDIVLGLALKSRGHKVKFVICDRSLDACEVKKATNKENWNKACSKCWFYGKSLFTRFGFEVVPVSQLIKNRSLIKFHDWDEIVEASLLKHLGVGVLDDTDEMDKCRERYKKTTAKTQMIGEALVEMNPDRVIMSHGIYSTWGPQRNLLNAAKIPVVTYSKCKKRHTEKFNWTTSADWWDVSKEWESVSDIPLDEKQTAKIDNYLASRREHSSDTLKYNFGTEETRLETYKRLNLDESKKTFIAFTNVLWDAASAQREIVFDDPIDWILETIEWFRSNPEIQLVVKIHPAEVVIGTNQPFASIIEKRIPDLPDNVRIIEPQEEVNSWSIMQIADLGLVHTSTVGMEMPLEQIPCATVSKTHFRGRGFTIDVSDRTQYFDLIKNWNVANHDLDKMQTLAKRYAFLLFERYQLPFKFFYEPNHTDVRALNFDTLSQLSNDKVMSLIANSIEQKQEFLLPANFLEVDAYAEA